MHKIGFIPINHFFFVDRGYDFRPDYGKLDTIASIFPSKPFIAVTATAPVAYQDAIIEKFAMQNPLRVLENPNQSNVYYEIKQRPPIIKESNEDQFEKLIINLGNELKELKNKCPLTIVYTSLHLCGFGYNLLEQQLGDGQYFPPGCEHVPRNRLFAQFHSRQSKSMKEEMIKDVTSESPIQRLLLLLHLAWAKTHHVLKESFTFGFQGKWSITNKKLEGQEEMANLLQQLCIITAMIILQLIWKGWMTV